MLEKAVFYAEYQSIAAQGHSGLFSLSIFVRFNDVEVNNHKVFYSEFSCKYLPSV